MINQKTCEHCHQLLPNQALFCPTCGTTASGDTRRPCPRCGRTTPGGARFCEECGANLFDPSPGSASGANRAPAAPKPAWGQLALGGLAVCWSARCLAEAVARLEGTASAVMRTTSTAAMAAAMLAGTMASDRGQPKASAASPGESVVRSEAPTPMGRRRGLLLVRQSPLGVPGGRAGTHTCLH